jgi:hypothetical protein
VSRSNGLKLVDVAEEAVKEGRQADCLKALAVLRECLLKTGTKLRNYHRMTVRCHSPARALPQRQQPTPDSQPAAPRDHQPNACGGGTKNASLAVWAARAVAEAVEPASNAIGASRTSMPVGFLLCGVRRKISKWNQVLLSVANRLFQRGTPLPELSFLKRSPSAFSASARLKTLDDGSLIDVGDDRPNLIRKTRQLLRECRCTGLTIAVELGDGSTVSI